MFPVAGSRVPGVVKNSRPGSPSQENVPLRRQLKEGLPGGADRGLVHQAAEEPAVPGRRQGGGASLDQ